MLGLEIAMLSEPGGRARNEDACGHWHSGRHLFCVLADGAGGHGGGAFAARLAVQHLLDALAAQPPADAQALNQLIRQASREVREARVADTERADMHCTVVCLVLDFVEQRAWWAHAGDSRLYWFRRGRLLERTRDHSLVQMLLDAGLLEADQLRTHPRRSELRSALGTDDSVLEVEDSGTSRMVEPGDAFLLCTDGIWEHLEDDRLEAVLTRAASPREWLQALEAQVRTAVLDKPDHDNFTALAVWTAAVAERT